MTNSVGTSSCFCCFDLKIGGLIIGYIGLICNVLEVALWNDTFEMNCISRKSLFYLFWELKKRIHI